MDSYFSQAGSFLISTLIGLYLIAVVLRFLFQWVRADFYNPLSQFLVRITNPLLIPLRRFIPGWWGLDMAALVLAYGLKLVEITLLLLIKGVSAPIILVFWLALGQLIELFLYIYLFAIIIQAVISWLNPDTYNPAVQLLHQLTAPVLRPARKILPPFSGMDLSPLLAIIVINLLIMMVPYIFA